MVKRMWILVALLWGVSFSVAAQEREVEILWDTWGVPHIYAADLPSLWYGFGWAQAQFHGDLLLRLYAQARGQAAEYGGADYADEDQLVRTLGIPQEGAAGYAAAPPEFQRGLEAFAAGMSDYIAAHPEAIDDTWEAVAPITGADILRHGARSLRYNFLARTGVNAAWQGATTTTMPSGSNAWAIAPSRSASGHALLVANPHQPWFDMGLWMEAHFILPDLNLYGAALMGSPTLNIAFNDHLGWTHTVNTHDGWDVYQLQLLNGGYLLDGAEHAFETRAETIRILQDDGTFQTQTFTVKSSVHGVVLAEQDDGTALALRVAGTNSHLAAWQWWQMGNATNLAEFEQALEPLAIPMFTIMYADREGNILHVFNEQIPIRNEGDWAFWNNTTPISRADLAVIDGTDSRYVWTEFHPYSDLPKVLNPPTGWLQNANEPPWTTTYPYALEPADYPAYFAPAPFVWPRPLRSMRILYEDDSITFDELVQYKMDVRMELADEVLDDLIAAAQADERPLAQRAAAILAAWDRRAHRDSVGGVLFTLWALTYVQEVGFSVFAVPWDYNDPLNTPRGLSDLQGAVDGLVAAAQQLEAARLIGGGMDMAYGEAFRLRYMDSGVDLPANGGFDVVGTFSVLTFVQDTDLRFYPVHGDSFIAVIEFGETVRAKVLLTHGNATQPNSPHVGDQLALFSAQQLRDAWRTRAEVEANLARREVLRVP